MKSKVWGYKCSSKITAMAPPKQNSIKLYAFFCLFLDMHFFGCLRFLIVFNVYMDTHMLVYVYVRAGVCIYVCTGGRGQCQVTSVTLFCQTIEPETCQFG